MRALLFPTLGIGRLRRVYFSFDIRICRFVCVTGSSLVDEIEARIRRIARGEPGVQIGVGPYTDWLLPVLLTNSPIILPRGGNMRHYASALASSAIGLMGLAGLNRLLRARAERRHPPAGAFIYVEGTRLHYIERGQGAPIVLIHGSGSLLQDFCVSGLVDRLSRSHRVLAFDRPGYGYSDRPGGVDWTPEHQAAVFVKACAGLGAERPTVIGHSWGTLPVLAWALNHPDQINRIALLSGYFYPTVRPDAALTAVMGSPVVGDAFAHTLLPLQARLTGPLGNRMIFSPASPTPAFMEEMPFGLMLRPGQLHSTAQDSGQMPAAAARLSRRYSELSIPMAIIWGDEDKLVDQGNQSAKLAIHLPHAIAEGLEGVGHMVHHTETERVAR